MSTNYNSTSQNPDSEKIAKDLVLLGVDALTLEDVAVRHGLEVSELIAFIQTEDAAKAVMLAEAESNLSGKTLALQTTQLIKRLIKSFEAEDIESLPHAVRLRIMEAAGKTLATLKGVNPEARQIGTGFSVNIIMGDAPIKEVRVIDMGDAEEVRP